MQKKVEYIYVYFLRNSKSKSFMIMSSVPTVSGNIWDLLLIWKSYTAHLNTKTFSKLYHFSAL